VRHRLGLATRTQISVCKSLAISFCRHRTVPVLCENGSAETTVAEGGQNLVARLLGHTVGDIKILDSDTHHPQIQLQLFDMQTYQQTEKRCT